MTSAGHCESFGANPASVAHRVQELAAAHFADVPACCTVRVRLGRRSRYRLGSVRAEGAESLITLNPLLLASGVPDYVLDATILHELAHLAHGFGTKEAPLIAHPHRGGVVVDELDRRGCGGIARMSDAWVKEHWARHFTEYAGDVAHGRAQRALAAEARWARFLSRPDVRGDHDLARLCAGLSAAAGCQPPPDAGWLRATLRQTRMLYVCSVPPRLRLHGLLAHRSVPECVPAEQIAVWLVGRSGGRSATEALMKRALGAGAYADAVRWRSRCWSSVRKRLHPLESCAEGRSG